MKPAAPVTRMGGTDIYLPFNSQPPQIDDGGLALAIEPRLHVEDDASAVLQQAGHEIPSATHIFLMGDRKDDGVRRSQRRAVEQLDPVLRMRLVGERERIVQLNIDSERR